MIKGNKERKIADYFPAPIGDEVYGRVKPEEGEEIIGIPFSWFTTESPPFIEHRRNGVVTMSVNVSYVVDIRFKEEKSHD